MQNNNSATPKWGVKSKLVETTTFDYPKEIPMFICRFIDELLTGIQHQEYMVAFTRDYAVPLAVYRWMMPEAQKVVDQFKYEMNDNLTRANIHSALVDVLYYVPKVNRVCPMGRYLDDLFIRHISHYPLYTISADYTRDAQPCDPVKTDDDTQE